MSKDSMEFKGRTPLLKISKIHHRNQSGPKNYQLEKDRLSLPPINKRQFMNQAKYTPKKKILNSNISLISNLINNRPQNKFVNSFSDARLPDEFCDLSYDDPLNE